MSAVFDREPKPRLRAGFAFLILVLACAGTGPTACEAQEREELENSVSVSPESLEAGQRRSVYLVRRAGLVPEGCSRKNKGYRLTGTKLGLKTADFFLDTAGFPAHGGGASPAVLEAVSLAASAWSSQGARVPRFAGHLAESPVKAAFALDERNTISWGTVSPFPGDTLAAVELLIDDRRDRVIEFDVLLAGDAPWSVSGSSGAPQGSSAGFFDIQNAMTHVFGHVLGLAEMPGEANCGSSMYPRISLNETGKRRLSAGDRAALRRLYP